MSSNFATNCIIWTDWKLLKVFRSNLWLHGVSIRHKYHPDHRKFTSDSVERAFEASGGSLVDADLESEHSRLWMTRVSVQGAGTFADDSAGAGAVIT